VKKFGEGHRFLVRIDAHCGYPDNYVCGLVAAAREHGATSVVVPMVTVGEGGFQKAAAAAQNSVLGNGGSAHRRITTGEFVDHGHHALFDLELYCRVGGYDEAFSHNEDAELDQRILAAGGSIWLEPSLALKYWPRRTPWALFRQYHGYGRGRAMNLMRHAAPIKLRQAIPVVIAPIALLAMLGLLFAPANPWTLVLALPAFGWAALCLGFGALLGMKARSLWVAAAGLAAMISHFAWSAGFLGAVLLRRRPKAPPQPIGVLCGN
ncbi:MAG: succinoglycan biosynthesis protein exoa, partial [Novosphingobium sp.]